MTDTPDTSPEAVDELVERMRTAYGGQLYRDCTATLRALSADRDEALNQLDSARHSVDVLESRAAKLKAERDAANEDVRVLLREIYSRDAYMSPALKAIHNRLVRHQKETDT